MNRNKKTDQVPKAWNPNSASARIIRGYLADKRISADEFADRLKVSKRTVYHWRDGMAVGKDNLPRVLEEIGCSADVFLGLAPLDGWHFAQERKAATIQRVMGPAKKKSVEGKPARVLLLGEIWAGIPGHEDEGVKIPTNWEMDGQEADGTESVYISSVMWEDALRAANDRVVGCVVRGGSMAPEYLPGDVVLVEVTKDMALLKDRDHIIVRIGNGEGHTLKEYRPREGLLLPINPREGRGYALADCPEMALFGRVVGLYRIRK